MEKLAIVLDSCGRAVYNITYLINNDYPNLPNPAKSGGAQRLRVRQYAAASKNGGGNCLGQNDRANFLHDLYLEDVQL